jgi:hypothetical protein
MTRFALGAVLWGAAFSATCHAIPATALVKNISTGFDNAVLAQLPNNAADPDYKVGLGSVAHIGVTPIARSTPLPPPFFTDAASANSRWIGISSGIGEEGMNVVAGTYYLETTVDLSGYNASTALIAALRFGADNKMEELSINGASVWTRPISFGSDFFDWTTVGDIGLGSFQPGINTLRFEVLNDGTASTVMTLRMEGSVMAAVPEPAVGTLAATTLAGVACRQRQRRSSKV